MNKMLSLIKLEFEDSFNRNTKNYGIIVLIIIAGFIAILFSALINFAFYAIFNETEYLYIYPVILSIAVIGLTFFSSIYRTKSTLFSPKDLNNLTPLPIKKRQIIIAKLLLTYVEQLIFSLIIFLPCLILYSTVDLMFIFLGLILIITLPMLSLLFAFIISFAIQLLILKFNFLKHLGTVFYIIVIIGICVLSFLSNNLEQSNTDLKSLISLMETFPFSLIYKGFVLHNVPNILLYLVITFMSLGLVICAYSLFYDKIYDALNYVGKKNKFKNTQIKSSNLLLSIMKNDFKHLLNEQMFLISGLVPVILTGIFTIMFSFSFRNIKSEIDMSSIVLFINFFFLGLGTYTVYLITLEGKNFWINKVLPIKPKTYLAAKLLLNQIINGTLTIIIDIILIIVNKYSLTTSFFLVIMSQIYIFLIALIGLLFNLKFPKLVWSNFRQIKNTMASFLLSILASINGCVILFCSLLLFFLVSLNIAILVTTLIIVLETIIVLIMYNKFADKLYLNIEV